MFATQLAGNLISFTRRQPRQRPARLFLNGGFEETLTEIEKAQHVHPAITCFLDGLTDPRTTRHRDRINKKITRNLLKMISV